MGEFCEVGLPSARGELLAKAIGLRVGRGRLDAEFTPREYCTLSAIWFRPVSVGRGEPSGLFAGCPEYTLARLGRGEASEPGVFGHRVSGTLLRGGSGRVVFLLPRAAAL